MAASKQQPPATCNTHLCSQTRLDSRLSADVEECSRMPILRVLLHCMPILREGISCETLRRARISASQLHQLLRLRDRTNLQRLRRTLQSKSAWPQSARIEDLCDPHVSHKWLFHLDAGKGSVLAPHDFVVSVQRRQGDAAAWSVGPCGLCGAFLDPQMKHCETCRGPRCMRGILQCSNSSWRCRSK